MLAGLVAGGVWFQKNFEVHGLDKVYVTRRGAPLVSSPASVTVVARTCAEADVAGDIHVAAAHIAAAHVAAAHQIS